MRDTGILLHISSLPSNYGIGTYGKAAYRFIDFLVKSGQTYWQILPLGPTSFGDSPYQTFSAFANNPYFIDLDILVKEGLLETKDIIASYITSSYVEYKELYEERYLVLRKAFNRFDSIQKKYQTFIVKNNRWLEDYALFMAIKENYKGRSWLFWEEDIRLRKPETMKRYRELLQKEIEFHQFLQFKAHEQWYKLKKYANKSGIKIFGDMPIYVACDSSDVWAHPEFFDLDKDKMPNHVAGVPPDNFSDDGQLWGNPLYKWDELERNNYQWWVDRIDWSTELFDLIRIDHFIGFQNYYSIKYGEKTAIEGQWKKGPGMKLFNAVKQKLGNVNIVAEDLGVVTEEVRELLRQTGFPGMKLLQFAFDSREENNYIPHLYCENVIAYTGTHDNETTKTWFDRLLPEDLKYCLDYINHCGAKNRVDSLIKTTLGCIAKTTIIPLQDYLNIGEEARMNIPSTTGNNWRWRVTKQELNIKLRNKIKAMAILYGRNQEKE